MRLSDNLADETRWRWARSKRFILALGALAAIALVAAYMTLPVFTIGRATTCGIEEHTHGEACYQTTTEYVCGLEESAGHVHGPECVLTNSTLTCTIPEHHHVDACYATDDVVAATEEPSAHASDPEVPQQASARVMKATCAEEFPDYSIEVSVGSDAGIPHNAELVAREIKPGTEQYESCLEQAKQSLQSNGDISFSRFFDISFLVNGEEIEPLAPVDVRVSYDESIPVEEGLTCSAVHFADAGVEVIDAEVTDTADGGSEVAFTQASFSIVGTVLSEINGFTAGDTYIFYADGYALGVNGSGSLTAYPVKIVNDYVTPVDPSVTISKISWEYVSNGLCNASSGGYLYIRSGSPTTRSTAQTITGRFVGNVVRLSGLYNSTRYYLGYTATSSSCSYSSSSLYADGDYFAVAKVADVSETITEGELTITESIREDGCLRPSVASSSSLYGRTLTYTWMKSTDDGATWTEVERTLVTGDKYNVAEDGSWLNVAYDKGSGASYKVVVKSVDGLVSPSGLESIRYEVPYYNELRNGSFETPFIDPSSSGNNEDYQPFFPHETSGLVWKTTASDAQIEVVSTSGSGFANYSWQWHNCESAADGLQYAELNANMPGALYQDVLTTPGATMYWQAAHRGRGNSNYKNNPYYTDTMYVVIMSTKLAEQYDVTTQAAVLDVVNSPSKYPGAIVKQCTTDNTAWVYHSGTSQIPEGQYLTRFFFVAGPTAFDQQSPGSSIEGTVGNHLDNVSFSETLPPPTPGAANLLVKKTIVGLDEAASDTLLDGMSFTIAGTVVSGADFTQLEKNDDGSYTATYAVRNISVGSSQSVSVTATERVDTANKEGYTRTTTVSSNGGSAVEGNSSTISIAKDATGEIEFTNAYEQPMGEVTFTKVDGAGLVLPGALFGMFTDETCSSLAADAYGESLQAVSSNLGVVHFAHVIPGTYYLMEIGAPSGYIPDTNVYRVEVSATQTSITLNGGEVASVQNLPSSIKLTLEKQDEQGGSLEGARFELYKKESGTYVRQVFNGYTYVEVGSHLFDTLEQGEYRLVEILAPRGHYKIAKPIEFTVSQGTLTITNASADDPWTLAGPSKGSDGTNAYTLVVKNHAGTELPLTGGDGNSLFAIGALMVLTASLIAIGRRVMGRKEERR